MGNKDINTLSKKANKQVQQLYQDNLYEIELRESYKKFLFEQYRESQMYIKDVINTCFDYGWTYGREFEHNLHKNDEQ